MPWLIMKEKLGVDRAVMLDAILLPIGEGSVHTEVVVEPK